MSVCWAHSQRACVIDDRHGTGAANEFELGAERPARDLRFALRFARSRAVRPLSVRCRVSIHRCLGIGVRDTEEAKSALLRRRCSPSGAAGVHLHARGRRGCLAVAERRVRRDGPCLDGRVSCRSCSGGMIAPAGVQDVGGAEGASGDHDDARGSRGDLGGRASGSRASRRLVPASRHRRVPGHRG